MQKNLSYQVVHSERLAPEVSRIFLRAPPHNYLDYQAGQYIKIVQNHTLLPFSIASAPIDPQRIELHICHPSDNASADGILRQVNKEKKLYINGPYGKCTVTALSLDRPLIFLARGTGFAPVKAIIEELIRRNTYPAMHLYWGATTAAELYLSKLVQHWQTELTNFSYTPVLSRVNETWSGKVGWLQQVIGDHHSDLSGYQVYASGPLNIIQAALPYFQERGLAKEFFYSDIFDYVSEK